MHRQQYSRVPHRSQAVVPAVLLLFAVLCIAAGLYFLGQHFLEANARRFRAPAGLWLVLLGLTEIRLVAAAWQRRAAIVQEKLYRHRALWRWLLAGPVVCYLICLALSVQPDAGYLFVAGVATWCAAATVPIVGGAPSLAELRRLSSSRPAVRSVATVAGKLTAIGYGVVTVFVAAEVAVQTYGFLAGEMFVANYVARRQTLPPGSELGGRKVNQLGYWDEPFTADRRPGVPRIAVVGDGITLSGTAQTNCVEQIQQLIPGAEVYNFGLPEGGPREYAAQVAYDAARFRPDLVLMFLSVGDDVTQELPSPCLFDWRRLGLYQAGAGMLGWAERGGGRRPAAVAEREVYLRETGRHLAVCRTPIEPAMNARWQKALGHLDEIVRICRQRKIAAGLVLAPSEFQISPQLCRSLLRQAGCQPEQLDLDLPQRRLALFADQRQLPVIDLLPHFRAATSPCYCRHACSWNEQGNTLAAQVVGQWILRRFGSLATAQTAPAAGGLRMDMVAGGR